MPAEDDPPLDLPSIPPEPIESFREPSDTEPAPTSPLAEEVAAAVLAALRPELTSIKERLDRLELVARGVDTEVVELRAWRTHADSMLDAIDRGVGTALGLVTDLTAAHADSAKLQKDTANAVLVLDQRVEGYHNAAISQYDSLGARVVKLEDYRREQTGEDDGSLAAAAIRGSHPGE